MIATPTTSRQRTLMAATVAALLAAGCTSTSAADSPPPELETIGLGDLVTPTDQVVAESSTPLPTTVPLGPDASTTLPPTSVAATTVAPSTTSPPTTPPTTAPPTTAPPTTAPETTTTTTTTEPPLEDLVIPLDFGESAITESVTTPRDGSTSYPTPGPLSASITTIGVGETDASEVVATWTIPAAVFAAYGPEPQFSVFFDSSVSASLATADWAGNSASIFITVDAEVGGTQIGRSEAALAEIGRGDRERLDREQHIAGFGSPVDLTTADGALVVEFRVICAVAGSTNLFGFGAESSCDAENVNLSEARVTVRATDVA